MYLREFYEAAPQDWQDTSDDHSIPKWGEGRKTKLTLQQINKMRRMNEVQAYERAKGLEKIRKQYGAQPQAAGPSL